MRYAWVLSSAAVVRVLPHIGGAVRLLLRGF